MLDRFQLLDWLRETDPAALNELWRRADEVRRAHVGDEVHLRGLVEISNYCRRTCLYCGLRAPRTSLVRYRLSQSDVLDCARKAVKLGYGTVVLQAGEDEGLAAEWVESLVRRIKERTPLAVTLSLGERNEDELERWRAAGADRYLLRFETSNLTLLEHIHPPRKGGSVHDRFTLLRTLKALGYEVGSGVMIGLPGQTLDDLANDLQLFQWLDLDMIGVGPYMPHPETPLGELWAESQREPNDPLADRETMTYKMIALSRLLCPRANIPSTTALATLNPRNGRELGLQRGANVVMPNLTPTAFRTRYELYPGKVCITESAETCGNCLRGRIAALGRRVGQGQGSARRVAPSTMESIS